MTSAQENIIAQVKNTAQWKDTWTNRLQTVCDLIHRELDAYDWVGFYFLFSERSELVLGPFAGKPTEHVKIPVERGICGQVAESGEALIVQDVTEESNYISCGLDVKSEIVVPMYRGEEMVGQIDIDSHKLAAFNEEDQQFLEQVNELLAPIVPADMEELNMSLANR